MANNTDDDDGWDDDDDDDGMMIMMMMDDDNVEEKPVVDHTPPPPPLPTKTSMERVATDAAIFPDDNDDDDDISRDDTLSIDNSRRLSVTTTEEGNAPKMVDHTPSVVSQLAAGRTSSPLDVSLAVLAETAGTAGSLEGGDSLDSAGDSRDRFVVEAKTGKMVDHTPTPTRINRRSSVDPSLVVTGHLSVGESLDSINEEGEVESDVSGLALQDDGTEIPLFGSSAAITPTAAAGGGGGSGSSGTPTLFFESETTQQNNNAGGFLNQVPLVDHTPIIPLVKSRSFAASVDVLSDSSSEEGFVESEDGVDDVNEDIMFGKVVDHTPETPNPSNKAKVGSAMIAVSSENKQLEDDTVLCVAEGTDVASDFKHDDEMDDGEFSQGGTSALGSTLEDLENRSLLGDRSLLGGFSALIPLAIPEESNLVDHIPETKASKPADASTMVLFDDTSSASSRVNDNVVNDDDETAPSGFGPIVDHTPSVVHRPLRSVATSVATQNSGLEVDLKLDEEMDNTVVKSTEDGEKSWVPEGESTEAPPISEENHVVDHVPTRRAPRTPVDGSIRVLYDQYDDMTQVDTIVTIEENTAVDFGPIVDQTPFSVARSAGYSIAASVATQGSGVDDNKHEDELDNTTGIGASVGEGSGWDQDEPELEDISVTDELKDDVPQSSYQPEENNLVDHVPRRSFARPADASIRVLVDPLDAVDEVDDVDENDGNVQFTAFGPVVDQTPQPPPGTHISVEASMLTQGSGVATDIRHDDDMDGTWFGASTIGGVSTVGASTGGGSTASSGAGGSGWDDDENALDDLASPTTSKRPLGENHVVDHVPSISSPPLMDASMAVVVDPSVISSQNEGDADEDQNIDGGNFGAVVDHTPSVARVSHYSVANSMATHATDIATDIKRDDEMDETTWNGGVSTQGDGWDQDEPELEELDVDDDDEMPHLVDHVPERPESRCADASTIVAADPYEMCSQVDDFNQDETNFGPVVDLTPLSEFVIPLSAVGSTIVALPSVVDDDLDDAVENAIDGEERNTDEQQVGWTAAPNPQSGGGDESSSSEQLVDYVPPEDEMPELVHDGSSEMATVEEKSLLPADEAKEDEYGPVVDHTPQPDPTRSPNSDHKIKRRDDESKKAADSSASGVQHVDSIAPQFSDLSEDNKDDGLDEDEFGPVVDHLPPSSSSKASFPPSRGGSTVDALATVSEVDDDLNGGGGWEDEPIDVSDVASPTAIGRPLEDKNLSVTWIDRLSKKDSAAFLQKSASVSKVSNTNTGDSGFFSADMGDSSRLSLDETRYYDPELGDSNAWDDSLNENDLNDGDDTPPSTPKSLEKKLLTNTSFSGCKACSDASTTDCPCVQRLLETNGGTDAMVGSLKTPEGEYVKVNFEEILQTEMTKRRLVEKELQALRDTILSLQSSKDSLTQAGEYQMDVLNKLHQSNNDLTHDLSRSREECDRLRSDKESLESKSKEFERRMSDSEAQKNEWDKEESSMKCEIDQLKALMEDSSSAAARNLSTKENELKAEITKWKQSHSDLSQQFSQFETECANLRGKNESLYEDLESYRQSVSALEVEKDSLVSKEAASNAEIQHLKASLESQASSSSSNAQIREQIGSIQSKLATKTGECEALKPKVAQLQQRLTASEADKFKQTKDLARLTNNHNQTISDFKNRLDASKKDLEEARAEKESSCLELETRLASETDTAQKLRTEKIALEQEHQRMLSVHSKGEREQEQRLKRAEAASRSAEVKLKELEEEKKKLSAEMAKYLEQAKNLESLSVELLSATRERDVLKEALVESKSTITKLQKQVDEHEAAYAEDTARLELEIEALKQERERNITDSKDQAKSAELLAEINELRRHAQVALEERQSVEGERQKLDSRCSELDNELKTALAELASTSQKCSQMEFQLSEHAEELRCLTTEKNTIASERDHALFRCKSAEDSSSKVGGLEGLVAGFDQERARLNTVIQQNSSSAQMLNEEINRLTGEKQVIMEERGLLEEDNEEMFVQFGLLKEQMDASEQQLAALQEELQIREGAAEQAERLLKDSEEKLEELARDLSRVSGDAKNAAEAEMQSAREQFASETAALQKLADTLKSENESMENRLLGLESANTALTDQVEALQSNAAELNSSSKSEEVRLLSIIEDMDAQCKELAETCHLQERNISQLTISLEQSQSLAEEASGLRQRVDHLEQLLSDHQRLVQQKDGALQDLQYQLEHYGQAPLESVELETLRQTVQEMEDSAERDRHHIRELEQLSNETQDQLKRTTSELSSAEILSQQLKSDLESRKRNKTMNQNLESCLSQSEYQLEQARAEGTKLRQEASDLRNRVALLESELQDARQRLQQPTEEPSGESSAEIQSLRQQLEVLKRQQMSSASETGAREESIEKEVHKLQEEMKKKDSQMAKLERELHVLGTDLSRSHEELLSKQNHVEKLSSKLEDLRSADQPATSRVLELTRDEAESTDQMRSQIISLAKALENSESRRAESIERLEKERKANADSLRRLTESVKRFYSTLNFGDS